MTMSSINNKSFYRKKINGRLVEIPRVPPYPHIEKSAKNEEPKSFWQKLADMDKLMSWVIMALLLAFPFTFFIHFIIYWIDKEFFIYKPEYPFSMTMVWLCLLYITCLLGFLLCRLAVVIYEFIEDQAFFN